MNFLEDKSQATEELAILIHKLSEKLSPSMLNVMKSATWNYGFDYSTTVGNNIS